MYKKQPCDVLHLLEWAFVASRDLFMKCCRAFSLASISEISAEWSKGLESITMSKVYAYV